MLDLPFQGGGESPQVSQVSSWISEEGPWIRGALLRGSIPTERRRLTK